MICLTCEKDGTDYCLKQCSKRTEYRILMQEARNDKSDSKYQEPCYI
jgi:hypothetical protein